MQGFTRSNRLGSIVRDEQSTTPPAFETNLTATSRTGTTLTANGTPHTKATTYTDLIASTAAQAFGFWITAFEVFAGATDTGVLCDVAVGAASSEVDLVTNIDFGEASSIGGSTSTGNGKIYYFPGLNIAASSRISARIQATIGGDTAVVAIWMDTHAQWHAANSSFVTYGANTAASQGTSVPSGNAAFGAWTSIGSTTSREHKLFAVGCDTLGDTTVNNTTGMLVEIGFGPDIGSVTSIGIFQIGSSTGETLSGCFPPMVAFPVASGSQLWARIASTDTENRGIIIYGN